MAHIRLAAIVLGAMLVASLWLIRVPFLQETDEQAHADYAYALFDAGGLFHVERGVARDRVTPEVRYLAARSNFHALRHDPAARVPVGYGTLAYYRALDAGAPRPSHVGPLPGQKVAYVIYNYPIGYYALAALAMAGAYAVSHGSLVATYFAARALGIAFLGITLVAAYDVFRRSRLSQNVALALTAALGFLPLASWVSAYIQPDTLTVACVTVVLALSLRLRARPFDPALTAWLAAALVLTFFVKQHYGLVLAVAIDATIFADAVRLRPNVRALAPALAGCALAPVLAYVAATHLTPVGALVMPPVLAHAAPAASRLAGLSRAAGYAGSEFFDVFVSGGTFITYWLYFGDLLTPYITDPAILRTSEMSIGFASLVILGALAFRQLRVYVALVRIVRTRVRASLGLLFGDPILNVYVAWTLLLLAVYARSSGIVYLEGRYFLAMTVPAMLVGVRYVPRVLPRRVRKRVALTVASAWLTASIVLAPIAYVAMERRFYGAIAARGDSKSSARTAKAAATTHAQSDASRAATSANTVLARFETSGRDAR